MNEGLKKAYGLMRSRALVLYILVMEQAAPEISSGFSIVKLSDCKYI